MKVLLMHRERDFDPDAPLAANEAALTQDLELGTLLDAMAGEERFIRDVARKALLAGPGSDPDTLLYRQAILRDCLRHPGVIGELYGLALRAREEKRKHYVGYLSDYPGAILSWSVRLLGTYMSMLRTLRGIAAQNAGRFGSEGFGRLFSTLEAELGEDYLAGVEDQLEALKFRNGVLISAGLGPGGGPGTGYVLRKPQGKAGGWLRRALARRPRGYRFRLHPRDDAGARIVSDLRNRGLNLVANALAQSAEHVLGFFDALRTELAFYLGCMNLHGRLAAMGLPTCFPVPRPAGERSQRFSDLRDACLALHMQAPPVGNSVDADGKSLAIVTGPNQGGKTSFLRAIGLAQLMMQSGMFVAAESFRAEVCAGVFTHYRREEDTTMTSGKLDEELARMGEIADAVAPDSLLLFNESFAATNEREGSEIAQQIVSALLEKDIKVFFVTHLYGFARGFFDRAAGDGLFLRAERRQDGSRTFRMLPGEPLETSFGEDVLNAVFGPESGDADPGRADREAPRRTKARSRTGG